MKRNVYVDKPAIIEGLKDDITRHIKGIEPQSIFSVVENLDLRWSCAATGFHTPVLIAIIERYYNSVCVL